MWQKNGPAYSQTTDRSCQNYHVERQTRCKNILREKTPNCSISWQLTKSATSGLNIWSKHSGQQASPTEGNVLKMMAEELDFYSPATLTLLTLLHHWLLTSHQFMVFFCRTNELLEFSSLNTSVDTKGFLWDQLLISSDGYSNFSCFHYSSCFTYPRLALNSLYSWGLPGTSDTPASTSPVLGL